MTALKRTVSLLAAADGSTTIYFGPDQPKYVKRGNWVQTVPGKGWFTILRLYSPLAPLRNALSWSPLRSGCCTGWGSRGHCLNWPFLQGTFRLPCCSSM